MPAREEALVGVRDRSRRRIDGLASTDEVGNLGSHRCAGAAALAVRGPRAATCGWLVRVGLALFDLHAVCLFLESLLTLGQRVPRLGFERGDYARGRLLGDGRRR